MRLRRSCLVILWALAVVACGREVKTLPATAVVVSVNSDIATIASLRVTVLDAAGMKPGGTGTYPIDGDKAKFPFSFTVAPPAGSSFGHFSVRIDGLDDKDVVLASVHAQATFVGQKTRLLTLWLAKLCQGVSCDEGQTCHYEEGDRKAGKCGDILAPKLTDFEPGADGDLSQFPTLAAPTDLETQDATVTVPDDGGPTRTDAGPTAPAPSDADSPDAEVDAGPAQPPAPNVPTVGSFRPLGERRTNSDNSLIVFDDGFEESGKICNPDGLCAVAGFVP
jgi:hypothetical protein